MIGKKKILPSSSDVVIAGKWPCNVSLVGVRAYVSKSIVNLSFAIGIQTPWEKLLVENIWQKIQRSKGK